jgi:hypothetical protein
MYSIYFPVMEWTTALAWCAWDQWWFPRAMAIRAVFMPQKSSWDKLRGARFCERLGTLGGEGWLDIVVITLGSNGALVVSRAWIVVWGLVWRGEGAGEIKIGLDDLAWHGRWVILAGGAGTMGMWTFSNLSLKMSASAVSAEMVSSPTWVNGTSGCGCCNAFDMSLAAMSNMSVEDNCGIW